MVRLRHQGNLGADHRVAEVVARPVRIDERIIVVDAPSSGVGGPEGRAFKVPVDARIEPHVAENLGAAANTDRKSPDEMRDAGEALMRIPLGTIGAYRNVVALEDFA